MPPRKRTITAKRETVTEEVTLTEEAAAEKREPMCVCDAYGGCPQGCPQCAVCWGDAEAAWARLTAPLVHYEFPVWPQSWWAASDAYRDQLAADWGPDGVAAFGDAAEAVAREAVFGPCRDPLLRQAAIMPAMLP